MPDPHPSTSRVQLNAAGLFLMVAQFSRSPALILVCNLAVPAAANHNVLALCNIGMKMPDNRARACDTNNGPQIISTIMPSLPCMCIYR